MRRLTALATVFTFVIGTFHPVPLFAFSAQREKHPTLLSAPSKVNGPSELSVGLFVMAFKKAMKQQRNFGEEGLLPVLNEIIKKIPGAHVLEIPMDDGPQRSRVMVVFEVGHGKYRTLGISDKGKIGKDEETTVEQLTALASRAVKGGETIRLALLERPIAERPDVQAVATAANMAESAAVVATIAQADAPISEDKIIPIAYELSENPGDFGWSKRGDIETAEVANEMVADANAVSSVSNASATDVSAELGDLFEPPPPPVADTAGLGDGNGVNGMPVFFGGSPPPEEPWMQYGLSKPDITSSVLRFVPPNVKDSRDGHLLLLYAHLADYLNAAETIRDLMQANISHGVSPRDSTVAAIEAWMHAPAIANGPLSNIHSAIHALEDAEPDNKQWPELAKLMQNVSKEIRAQIIANKITPVNNIAPDMATLNSILDALPGQSREPVLFVTNSPTRSNEIQHVERFLATNREYRAQHGDEASVRRDRDMNVVNHVLSKQMSERIGTLMKEAFFASEIPEFKDFVDSKLPSVPIVLMVKMSTTAAAEMSKSTGLPRAVLISREFYEQLWQLKSRLTDKGLMGENVLTPDQANTVFLKTIMIAVGEEMTGLHIADATDPLEGELFEDIANYVLLTSLRQKELIAYKKLHEWIGQGDLKQMGVYYARGHVQFIDSYLTTLHNMLPEMVAQSERGIRHYIVSPWNLAQHRDELIFIPWLGANKAIGDVDPKTGKTYFALMRELNYPILSRAKIKLINEGFKKKFGKTFSELMGQVLAARDINARLAKLGLTRQLGLTELEAKASEILTSESAILKLFRELGQNRNATTLYQSLLEEGQRNIAIDISLIDSWTDAQGLLLAIDILQKMKKDGIAIHVLFGGRKNKDGTSMTRDQAADFLKERNLFTRITILAQDLDELVYTLVNEKIQWPEGVNIDYADKREMAKNLTTLILDENNWKGPLTKGVVGALTTKASPIMPSMPEAAGTGSLNGLSAEDMELFRVIMSGPEVELDRAFIFGALLSRDGVPGFFTPGEFKQLVDTWIGTTLGVDHDLKFNPKLRENGVFELTALDAQQPERKMRNVLDRNINMAREIVNSM